MAALTGHRVFAWIVPADLPVILKLGPLALKSNV
jgi:hypothetical protein